MKVLFVNNNIIGEQSATGNMMLNLFSGMEDIEILQYILHSNAFTKKSLFSNVGILEHNDFGWLERLSVSLEEKSKKRKAAKKVFLYLKRALAFLNEIYVCHISRDTCVRIKEFAPDLIYTLGSDVRVMRTCIGLSQMFDVPIVMHSMDDFYNFKYVDSGLLNRLGRKKLVDCYQTIYSNSKCGLAIGPKMAEEYSVTFKIPFFWAMNCVTDSASLPSYHPKDKIELIIFSGGLHGGRAETLEKIAKVIEDMDLKMEIYTSPKDLVNYTPLFSTFKNTRLLEYVERSKMFDNLSRADVLLHVESYYSRYTSYFRLSMSTKIPEYMSVCRPILCVGPSGIATVDFIQERKFGLVVNDINRFGDSLRKLEKTDLRVALVNNSKEVLSKEFFRSQMQNKLIQSFRCNINYSKNTKQ